jgi:CheY-like chemotaxis protein
MNTADDGPNRKVALVVDDEPIFCRSMSRLLGRAFDEVHVAGSPDEAEEILAAYPVTHLICDYRLGSNLPPGSVFVQKWREAYPGIDRAVVLTGALDYYVKNLEGIDSVRAKGIDPDEVLRAVLGEALPTRSR